MHFVKINIQNSLLYVTVSTLFDPNLWTSGQALGSFDKEEKQNTDSHMTARKQSKNIQLSLPQQDDCQTRKDTKNSSATGPIIASILTYKFKIIVGKPSFPDLF